jgi:Arm domain-containing DNA-binding protein/integrase-like protein
MARSHCRLTALSITRKKAAGYYADSDGLYLQVTSSGAKSWLYRFMLTGRRREMGLGALCEVSLVEARTRATTARQLVKAGQEPIAPARPRRPASALRKPAASRSMRRHDSTSPTTRAPGRTRCTGSSGRPRSPPMHPPRSALWSVRTIGTPEVTKVLDPIWSTKTETASRVRGRIELILDWAKARGLRTVENPARWRGHLDAVSPSAASCRKSITSRRCLSTTCRRSTPSCASARHRRPGCALHHPDGRARA